jgi:hypothetical protein
MYNRFTKHIVKDRMTQNNDTVATFNISIEVPKIKPKIPADHLLTVGIPNQYTLR